MLLHKRMPSSPNNKELSGPNVNSSEVEKAWFLHSRSELMGKMSGNQPGSHPMSSPCRNLAFVSCLHSLS